MERRQRRPLLWISSGKTMWDRTQRSYGDDEWYGRIQNVRNNGPDKRDVLTAAQGSATTSICIIPRTHGVSQTKASKILYHCGFSPLSKSTTLFGRSCQPSTILWMASTLATNSAWHSLRAWGPVRSEWYYQHKKLAFTDTVKSTWGSTVVDSNTHFQLSYDAEC